MNTTQIINLTFQICGTAISLSLLIGLAATKLQASRADGDFSLLLIINIIILASDAFTILIHGKTGAVFYVSVRVVNFVYFMAQIMQIVIFVQYQQHFIEEKFHRTVSKSFLHAAYACAAGTLLILLINLFHPILYSFDSSNVYHRMPFFAMITVLVILVGMDGFLMLLKNGRNLSATEWITFFFIYLFPTLFAVINTLFYGIILSEIGTTLAILFIYLLVQSLRGRYVAEQENERLKSQTAVMLSQVQPHFLFNALNTIDYLCIQNPKEAEKAVSHLAAFLRNNLDSVSLATPVPFTKEIEHVKNYLYIEHLRFPHIRIEFDLQEEDFLLPPLSVQPMVENAIKHGLRSVRQNARLVISSRSEADCWQVTIQDNGIGFDEKNIPNEGRQHIGIKSVRQRLALMCGGTLQIDSGKGGTTVTMRVPK